MRVIISGAGLGGLALAQGLTAAGIDVTVLERDPAFESRAQGARFHLDDRGLRTLREALSGPAFALVEATLGEPSETLTFLDDELRIAGERPFVGRDGDPDSPRPGRPASRQLLRRILAHGLDGRIRFGCAPTGFHEDAAGVTVTTAAGTERGDVLVGADGIGSAVRRHRLPHAGITDTGLRWLGGKTPLTAPSAAELVDTIKGSFTMTDTGEVRVVFAGMRFAEQPAEAAARLLSGFDPGDVADYLMWALILRRDQVGALDADWAHVPSDRLLAFAADAVAQAHPTVRGVVADAWPDQAHALAMGISDDVDGWPASRVTLLGDAVHAMTPNRASGANTALQDARRLRDALVAVDRGERELAPAIAGYEETARRDGYAALRASRAAIGEMTS